MSNARTVFARTSFSITRQTLPLAFAFATDCICAIVVTGMFRNLPCRHMESLAIIIQRNALRELRKPGGSACRAGKVPVS